MSSILTNTGSMVALQTLRGINKGLGSVQSEISTGLKVASSKDNASVWAIAATMKSDVGGYKQLSDSLATGSAAVGVARTAAESVSDLLGEMKEKIVAAQSPTADRAKLQADVAELRSQISSVVSAAQFNGLNLVNGDTADVEVLASLDRDATGNVTARNISVARQDLSTLQGNVADPTATAGGGISGSTAVADGSALTLTFTSSGETTGEDRVLVNVGGQTVSVDVALNGTTDDDEIATAVAAAITAAVAAGTITGVTAAAATNVVTITSDAGADPQNVTAGGYHKSAGMGNLTAIDVSTGAGALAALDAIEGLQRTAIDAAAALGSSQKRIEIQQDFVSKLIDSVNTGIGAMVDADMEEASARLTALQTQQQLGIQSLSIANQAPQSVLALFR